MLEDDALAAERTRPRLTCRHLSGNGPVHPAQPFEASGTGASITPSVPHTNMFHLKLDGEPECWLASRDRVARETGIWLFGNLRQSQEPAACEVEISIGSSALTLRNEEIVRAVDLLF